MTNARAVCSHARVCPVLFGFTMVTPAAVVVVAVTNAEHVRVRELATQQKGHLSLSRDIYFVGEGYT